MFDATAKLSSGVLSGNVNNYGDLDECLSINQPMHSIKGRHCGVRLQLSIINATSTPYIAFLHRLVQSFDMMKSKLNDVSVTLFKWLLHNFVYTACCTSYKMMKKKSGECALV